MAGGGGDRIFVRNNNALEMKSLEKGTKKMWRELITDIFPLIYFSAFQIFKYFTSCKNRISEQVLKCNCLIAAVFRIAESADGGS